MKDNSTINFLVILCIALTGYVIFSSGLVSIEVKFGKKIEIKQDNNIAAISFESDNAPLTYTWNHAIYTDGTFAVVNN